MMKKTSMKFFFFTIVTVISLSCPSLIAIQDTYNKITVCTTITKTIYVNCNNTVGPWNGTLDHPYRTVQDGVANASVNDTVFVFHGVYDDYAGFVFINKSLRLIGENKQTTILKRLNNYYIIFITADFVTVSNFTFKHMDPNSISYFVRVNSNFSSITDTVFLNPVILRARGIDMYNAHNNLILRNTFGDNKGFGIGITLTNSYNNDISDNIFYHCLLKGIFLLNSTCNAIINNTVQGTTDIGIALNYHSDKNNIFSNKAVSCIYAIFLADSSYNTVSSNEFAGTICATFSNCVNHWNNNYWERARFLPKLIFGTMLINRIKVPWFNIDWHPAISFS